VITDRSCIYIDTCQPNLAFHCDFGRCIPLRLLCDEYQDCEDGTDETDCVNKVFDSCQDVWESGYRKSGYYNIIGLFNNIELKYYYVQINSI
jgi:hypothetical protein